jgi:hypothetical protein
MRRCAAAEAAMKASDMFRHQLRWALAANVIGLLLLAGALWLRSVGMAMAAAIFLLSVGLGAKATMRCPFCQRPVASELIQWPLLWRSRVPERCPHCATPLDREM